MKQRSEEKDRTAPPSAAGLNPHASQPKNKERYREIGDELQRMFNDVLSEPIPEDLLARVKKLEDQSGGGSEPGA